MVNTNAALAVPLDMPLAGEVKRLGFMAGAILVPDDFDTMGTAEIDERITLACG